MKTIISIILAATCSLPAWAEISQVSVPVPLRTIEKGATIQPDDLTTAEFPSNKVFVSTVKSLAELTGQQAIRALPAGQPVNNLHVRTAPAVARGALVTLRFSRGGVQLTGNGQALQDGAVGQSIKVLNPATRATLVGTIASNNTVDIN